jgi:hypothetical protein
VFEGLYVEDFKPTISGGTVLQFVKDIASKWPGSVIYLEDLSNVKNLALLTTGKTYYEYQKFQFKDSEEKIVSLEKIKRRYMEYWKNQEIKGLEFKDCLREKMDEEVEGNREYIRFNENFKSALLGLVEVKETQQVADFWKIYRNAVKTFKIHELREKHGFDLNRNRLAKQNYFAKYNFDCLAQQIPGSSQLFARLPEYMEYP